MTYIAERRQEEKELRRAAILDAAEGVIARQGFDKTTLGDIAREARLSRTLLYTYFEDKEDLYEAILQRGLVQLHQLFKEAVSSRARGLDKMIAINCAYVEFSEQYPLYFDALAHFETKDIDPSEIQPNQTTCLHEGVQVHQLMAKAIGEGIADGSIRADLGDPMRTAVTMWGLIHGLIQLWTKKGPMLTNHYQIDGEQFMRHGLELAARSMANPHAG